MIINVVCDVNIPVKEAVTKNEDDSYTIFLAPWLDSFAMKEEYLHAMKHITNGDFETDTRSADECEVNARGKENIQEIA